MKKITGFIQKILSHNLARGSALVFAGSMAANVGSYLYHLVMGRILGPAGYGELASLLSILYIFSVPLAVVQTVLIKFISGFKAHGSVGQSKSLFFGVTRALAIVSIVAFPIVYVASPSISSFLHLSSPTLFIVLYLLSVLSFLSVPSLSLLNGYQQFLWVAIFAAGAIFIKLGLSIPMSSGGVNGVLWASIISSIIVYALYFIPIKNILGSRAKPTDIHKLDAFRYAIPTLFALLGITSLYSTDIILVRHFFAAKDAGLYAALAILGKIVFYASSAITTVLFPVVAERAAGSGATKNIIGAAAGAVAGISAVITAVYFIVPDVIVQLLFGSAYKGAGALLGEFGIFITLFSIGYVITMACLAIGKTRVWIAPASCALLQIVGISLVHSNINSVLLLNIALAAIYVISSGAYYLKTSHEKV